MVPFTQENQHIRDWHDHYWDVKAYQGQIDKFRRLGGTPIALDARRKDSQQIAQLQTLISQKADAIIEQLGHVKVLLELFLKRIRDAGISLFTVDTESQYAINVTIGTMEPFECGHGNEFPHGGQLA